jgi:hypothetical protein
VDRKARVARRSCTTQSFHATNAQSGRGTNVSLQRIEERGEVADRERDFEQRGVAEAREALVDLFDLLEEYAPRWYTERHRARALAAIKALQES